MKKVGIVRFWGSNCERDVHQAVSEFLPNKEDVQYLWHQDLFEPKNIKAIILPGGFSYGDYLRTGALSAKTPVMKSVFEANKKGVPILGICNGFQILCEAGLLPGVLLRNQGLRFIDEMEKIQIRSNQSRWVNAYEVSSRILLPIAHGEGRFYAKDEDLKALEDNDLIFATYISNPNGSCYDIAGITNKEKNILGLMPHPERAIYNWMGSDDGRNFFSWLS